MATSYCIDCSDCILINFKCISTGNTPLHNRLDRVKVLGAAKDAQLTWVQSVLQKDCFDALCQALQDDADNTQTLQEPWITLMQDYITPTMVDATTFEYIQKHGFQNLNLLVNTIEERQDYLKRALTSVYKKQARLKRYLENNTDTITCYVAEEENCNVRPKDHNPDWDVISRYPTDGEERPFRRYPGLFY